MVLLTSQTGGLLGYTAVVTALIAAAFAFFHERYKNRLRRQGIARLLYHRLLKCQSTLATAYYTNRWWSRNELEISYVESEDIKRVATALRANEWRVVNSALGWTEHLLTRQGRGCWSGPDQEDLEVIRKTYAKLELARWALRRVCGDGQSLLSKRPMPWDVHNQLDSLELAYREGRPMPGPSLRNLSPQTCRDELMRRMRNDDSPCEVCGHQHTSHSSAVESATAARPGTCRACTACTRESQAITEREKASAMPTSIGLRREDAA
jgi:hypothetical protein